MTDYVIQNSCCDRFERFVLLCKMQTRNTERNTMTSVTQTPMNATLGKKKTKSSKIIDTPVQGCPSKKSDMDDITMTPTTVMRSVEESNTPSQRAYVTDLKTVPHTMDETVQGCQ